MYQHSKLQPTQHLQSISKIKHTLGPWTPSLSFQRSKGSIFQLLPLVRVCLHDSSRIPDYQQRTKREQAVPLAYIISIA
jgi:hypothetical protein